MTQNVGGAGDSNHHWRNSPYLSDEVILKLETYEPLTIDRARWLPIAEMCRELSAAALPKTPALAARYLGTLARMCEWARRTALPLEPGTLLDPDQAERFIATEFRDFKPETRRMAGYALATIARMQLVDAQISDRFAREDADANPYLASDEGWIRSWAACQPTEEMRVAAHAMLGLCRGAGLKKSELLRIQVEDVQLSDKRVTVRVRGPQARTMPISASWDDEIRTAVEGLEPGQHLVRPNLSKQRQAALKILNTNERHGAVWASRLRATWIVEHLNQLPFAMLVASTGLKSAKGWTPYLPYVTPLSETVFLNAYDKAVTA